MLSGRSSYPSQKRAYKWHVVLIHSKLSTTFHLSMLQHNRSHPSAPTFNTWPCLQSLAQNSTATSVRSAAPIHLQRQLYSIIPFTIQWHPSQSPPPAAARAVNPASVVRPPYILSHTFPTKAPLFLSEQNPELTSCSFLAYSPASHLLLRRQACPPVLMRQGSNRERQARLRRLVCMWFKICGCLHVRKVELGWRQREQRDRLYDQEIETARSSSLRWAVDVIGGINSICPSTPGVSRVWRHGGGYEWRDKAGHELGSLSPT